MGWHYKAIHSISGAHNSILRVRARGLSHLPREGAVILAGNHTSYWDGILMQTALPRPVNILVRHEIMASRFGKWFFGRGGAIPVYRDEARNAEAFEAARQALVAGRVLGVFPEGGRGGRGDAEQLVTVGGMRLAKPKTGVARLALLTKAPVVPIAILTDRWWPRTRKVPNLREPIYLAAGPPLTYEGDAADPARVRKVADDVMHSIAGLLSSAQEARDRGERWERP